MKLSIVVVGRNDDYGGGGFLARLANCWACAPDGAEFILVEWNPPADKPTLKDVVIQGGIRIITVPPEIHQQIPSHERFPVFEYMAKNVGIRRARGEYILATNPDIIFSPEMRQRLAGDFSPACFYRADRTDLSPEGKPVKTWGATHRLHFNASGDFMLMHRDNWFALQGYPQLNTNSHIDSQMVLLADRAGLQQVVLREAIFHQYHRPDKLGRPEIGWNPPTIQQNGNDNWGFPGMETIVDASALPSLPSLSQTAPAPVTG